MTNSSLWVEVLGELELCIAEVILGYEILEGGIFAEQMNYPSAFRAEIEYHFDSVLIVSPFDGVTRLAG